MLTNIRELGREGAFDPETIQVMSAAFERVWASLKCSGAPFAADDYVDGAREILGKHIIMAARAGSRGEKQLCDEALLELAQSTRFMRGHRGDRPDGIASAKTRP
jgi:hypothetical protein